MQEPMVNAENYNTWAIKVESNLDADKLWEGVESAEDSAVVVVMKKDKPVPPSAIPALPPQVSSREPEGTLKVEITTSSSKAILLHHRILRKA
ncbi:hypothetical protein D1007_15015 [Hordeum vulgare]|nr:hypothetical protein D1007_15015 [Hordeum vulgare]